MNNLDIQGNSAFFGTTSSSDAAVGFAYSDGASGTNSAFTEILNRPLASWNWQRLNVSGTAVQVMQLNQLN